MANLDQLQHNADWTKQTLDLYIARPGGGMLLVDSPDRLLRWLEAHNMTVREFKSLPVYANAVRSGRYPWLRDFDRPVSG